LRKFVMQKEGKTWEGIGEEKLCKERDRGRD
jgi:hypothetical protein